MSVLSSKEQDLDKVITDCYYTYSMYIALKVTVYFKMHGRNNLQNLL